MREDLQTRERILIVEDEPSVLDLMARVLRVDGYEVVAVQNGQNALDRMQEMPFDFIICDVRMPGFDAEAFYEEIQRGYPSLRGRIAFVTGDAVSPDTERLLNKTGAPYLLKPFNLDDLKKMVGDSLERIGRGGGASPEK